jgi:hypothetical protein
LADAPLTNSPSMSKSDPAMKLDSSEHVCHPQHAARRALAPILEITVAWLLRENDGI